MEHLLEHIKVSTQKKNQFASRNINTIEELAGFFPRRYYDFREIIPISRAFNGEYIAVKGAVIRKEPGQRMNKLIIQDSSGYKMGIVFFGSTYLYNKINLMEEWLFCGLVYRNHFSRYPTMTNPLVITQSELDACKILPVYPKIKGMSQDYLSKKILEAISFISVLRQMDEKEILAQSLGLIPYADALNEIHFPSNNDVFKKAMLRVDFNYMYDFYEDLYKNKKYSQIVVPVSTPDDKRTYDFINNLPFLLTKGQVEAIDTIINEAKSNKQVNAIVTGDVGCGKTMVAIAAALFIVENGLQAAIMAPTLVLARQHYEEFTNQLTTLGIQVALLTSETKKAERTKVLEEVANGDVDILIGTHSILSPEIKFKALGITIIDEEHKFGVTQKEILEEFDKLGAHHVSMTATPIPRSYALSIYGDLLSVLPILDMPSGRKTIITKQFSDVEKVFERLYSEIALGHQAYLVTPFIEDSEDDKFKDIASVKSMLDAANKYFGKHYPSVRINSIDGKMKQKDIIAIIDDFAAGNIDILISTTIIEVGINVPNATAIAIMNADRFGLAALHQLRGRVGRKGDQGYCYLASDKAAEKLDVMCSCSSGFEIAEKDLKFRGPGDLIGEGQTGKDSLAIINTILKRPKLAAVIRASFE